MPWERVCGLWKEELDGVRQVTGSLLVADVERLLAPARRAAPAEDGAAIGILVPAELTPETEDDPLIPDYILEVFTPEVRSGQPSEKE